MEKSKESEKFKKSKELKELKEKVFFENRYYIDEKTTKEWFQKVIYRNTHIFCIFYEALFFCLTIYWALRQSYITAVLGIFMFCCMLLFDLIYPNIFSKYQLKSIYDLHNGKRKESVVTFSNKINFEEGSLSLDIEYSQIKKIYHLKHSMILMFNKKNGVLVKPDNFSIGTFEDFQSFIKQKCFNIQKIVVKK